MIGQNPDEFGPRFDMSNAYTADYRKVAHEVADKIGIKLDDGLHWRFWLCYETPAEIRAFKTLGADAVGMSLYQKSFRSHSGLKVLGISAITNFVTWASNLNSTMKKSLRLLSKSKKILSAL